MVKIYSYVAIRTYAQISLEEAQSGVETSSKTEIKAPLPPSTFLEKNFVTCPSAHMQQTSLEETQTAIKVQSRAVWRKLVQGWRKLVEIRRKFSGREK